MPMMQPIQRPNVVASPKPHATTASSYTSSQEEERKQQRIEALRRQEEELARAQELERRIASDVAYLEEQWMAFQQVHHNLPPELLPLEAEQEFEDFKHYVSQASVKIMHDEAFERFRARLNAAAEEGRTAFGAFEAALSWAQRLTVGSLRKVLGGASISLKPPAASPPASIALASAQKVLRSHWSAEHPKEDQSLVSVHKCRGRTIIQIGCSRHGFIYVTLPGSLDPDKLAARLLAKFARAIQHFLPSKGILAFYDGDYQGINPKQALPGHRVVRTMRDDPTGFLQKMPRVMSADAPTSANSRLHIGVPATVSEMAAVFHPEKDEELPDWDDWRDVHPNWRRRATRHGFPESGVQASREDVLQSLAVAKNVIIVAAHARNQVIYLPAPPPEGSSVGPEDLEEYKERISANKPMVYLFCCEVAEIDDLRSFAAKLLECGAAAVIAPQTQINAHRSAELFEELVKHPAEPAPALARLLEAEESTGYREMEVWVG